MSLRRLVSIVLLALALQVAFARYAVGGRFVFDFVLVGIVVVALQAGAVGGMVAGTVGGLLLDLASGGIIGLGGLVKTLVGYGAGVLATRFDVAKPHARAIVLAAATIVDTVLLSGLRAVIAEAWPSVAWGALLECIVINAAAGWVVFQLTEAMPGMAARVRLRRRTPLGRRQW